jgi:hypothetical protein
MKEESVKIVVDHLSSLINVYLLRLSSEQRSPVGDVDLSESLMKDRKNKVIGLRKIRNEFEILMSGAVL